VTVTGPASTATVTSTITGTPSPTPTNCVAKWGQCGGVGYTGPTCCKPGSTCQKFHDWYSQCVAI
jgi:hypothetical protein